MPTSELTLGVTLAVLGAGLLHAGWNALLKSAPGGDPLLDTATVVAGSGIWALVAIPAVVAFNAFQRRCVEIEENVGALGHVVLAELKRERTPHANGAERSQKVATTPEINV